MNLYLKCSNWRVDGNPCGPDINKPRAEIVLVIERFLAGQSLEEGSEYEYMPIDPIEPVESAPHSTVNKGVAPVAATLIENIKELFKYDLKQILSTISNEIEDRKGPLRSLSKTKDALLAHAHEVSSVLYNLIKGVFLEQIYQNCQPLVGRWPRGYCHLSSVL